MHAGSSLAGSAQSRQFATRGAFSSECLEPWMVCDVCSSRFAPLPHHHVSGNIWLARCDYVSKLLPPSEFSARMDAVVREAAQSPNSGSKDEDSRGGRYSMDHWLLSHPSVVPCDVYAAPQPGRSGDGTAARAGALPHRTRRLPAAQRGSHVGAWTSADAAAARWTPELSLPPRRPSTAAPARELWQWRVFEWRPGRGAEDKRAAVAMASSAALLAEFVGTFILVFTVGCNVVTAVDTWAGVSIACALMVAIYTRRDALAPISGANFNPAVSVALGISRKLEWKDVGLYTVTQVLAGACAGLSYRGLLGAGFALEPTAGFGFWQAGLCELLYTFMLCFVVLNTACSTANAGNHQFYGLSIGFVIVAGAYGAGVVSGGCFNPAVALGIEAGSLSFGYSPVYIAFELTGAALASALYVVVRPDEFELGQPAGRTAKVTSEFLGTYFLVLTVGLNVLGDGEVFSIAASLMCMIFALGDVSGAHFNPAVTAAVWAIGKVDTIEAGIYVCFQMLGAILATATYTVIYAGASTTLAPADGYGLGAAAVAEIFFTFVLCFVVLSVACSPSAQKGGYSEVFGLAIGSCVTVGGYAIGGISGGSLNPAVSFGVASGGAMGGEGTFSDVYTYGLYYALFEVVGGILAAGLYLSTHNAASMVAK
ncbi:unnamed protein product [Prorocentrum cordatum]|uniref:Aquaporin n=1 Tax=Prorocentrum cordatum TaxID=2364126 RepID=A0ABN9VCF7_9DINO|nr:unnamed protein product [Polarella glacialis]